MCVCVCICIYIYVYKTRKGILQAERRSVECQFCSFFQQALAGNTRQYVSQFDPKDCLVLMLIGNTSQIFLEKVC
jgi:hypothetical protein